MPTFPVCLAEAVVGSVAPTGFCPLIGAYRVDPSGEYLICPTKAAWPLTVGIEKVVGVPSVPSALTGNRDTAVCSGSQRKWPSGEYVGPSWPTVPFVNLWLTPDAVPTLQ